MTYLWVTGSVRLVPVSETLKMAAQFDQLNDRIILRIDVHEVSEEGLEIVTNLLHLAGLGFGNLFGIGLILISIFHLMKGLAVQRPIERSELCPTVAIFDNGSGVSRLRKDKAGQTDSGTLHLHFLTFERPENVLSPQSLNQTRKFELGMPWIRQRKSSLIQPQTRRKENLPHLRRQKLTQTHSLNDG